MNLDKMREQGNFFNNAIAWIERRVHMMNFSDQDVINNLFYGSIKLIDNKYNNTNPKIWEQIPDSIIHTPTPIYAFKTWGAMGLPSQHLYWKYYSRSAWGESLSLEDVSEVFMNAAEKTSSTCNHASRQYIVEVSQRIIIRIFYRSEIARIVRYLAKEAYHRIKQRLSPSR